MKVPIQIEILDTDRGACGQTCPFKEYDEERRLVVCLLFDKVLDQHLQENERCDACKSMTKQYS